MRKPCCGCFCAIAISRAQNSGGNPAGRYILDYYCVEKKLAVELDGGQHGEAADYDQHRDSWLRSQGIRVLRFWNNQMLAETEAVMEVIYQAIVEEAPLPQAGEGLG